MTRALLVTSVLLELVALSRLRVWLGVTLAWCELARAATANCGAGRGGKVSPSLDTIVCPGADTHRLASHWSAAGNTAL